MREAINVGNKAAQGFKAPDELGGDVAWCGRTEQCEFALDGNVGHRNERN